MENALQGESKWKGDKSELAIAFKLTMMDIGISKPMGDNLPYDLIMDINNNLYKIQVKTGSLSSDSGYINSHISRSIIGKDKLYQNIPYSKDEVDFFAIHCIETNESCLIPIKEVEGQRQIRIRRIQTKNNQTTNIRLLKDCILEDIIEKIRNQSVINTVQKPKEKNLDFPELSPRLRSAMRRVGISGYRGVCQSTKLSTKWECYLRYNKVNLFIGRGDDPRELAEMYDKKAIEILGEDAVTNRMLGLL
jgi:hypothetical protein